MKGKIKNIFYILIFLLSFITVLANTTTSVEPIWFATPSEYNGTEDGIRNGTFYKDSWYGISFNTNTATVIESLNDLVGGEPKSGENYFAIKASGESKYEGNWMAVKLNKTLKKNTVYNIRFWYYVNSLRAGVRYKIDTAVYLVKELPQIDEDSSNLANDARQYLDSKTPITTIVDPNKNNWDTIYSLNLEPQEDGEYYLLFVPEASTSSSGTSINPSYFAIEQANTSAVKININGIDDGVSFLDGNYKEKYGVNDEIVGKNEKVKVTVTLENTDSERWIGENGVEIDANQLGEIETGSYVFYKVKNDIRETLQEGIDYTVKIDRSNGNNNIIFKSIGLDSNKDGTKYEFIFYINYDFEINDPKYTYKTYDIVKENTGAITVEDSELIDKIFKIDVDISSETIAKRHSVISIPQNLEAEENQNFLFKIKSYFSAPKDNIVKLGDVIGRGDTSNDDGWISTGRSSVRTLYYGNNILRVKASHNGYLAGYLHKGVLVPGSTTNYNFVWEKVFETQVNIGENEIVFTTPNDTDKMDKFILKYSINRDDVLNLENYGASGEIENYNIEEGKSFDAEIYSRKDLGVSQDNLDKGNGKDIGVEDDRYSFQEKVEYKIKITNSSSTPIRNKKLIFISNMASVNTSDFKVSKNEDKDYISSQEIPRIERRNGEDGIYNILINEMEANTTYYVRFYANLSREDFISKDNWKLIEELRDGNISLDKAPEIEIINREYGNSYLQSTDELTEVRHYNPFLKNGETDYELYLGTKRDYNNKINDIENDETNDGVILNKYTGNKLLYKGKYAFFTGVTTPVYLGVNKIDSWITAWINNKDNWQTGEADRYFIFKNYDNSYYRYEGNPDNIPLDKLNSIGTYKYKIEVEAPNQPGKFKTFRVRTAYNQLEIDDPQTTASSGEVEDYEVVILPPLEPTIFFENLGVDIEGKTYWAGKKPVNLGSKVRYTIEIKNLVNKIIEKKSIVLKTNMVTLDNVTLKMLPIENDTDYDKDTIVTLNEITQGNNQVKEYEFICDSIKPLGKTKIVIEGIVDREDTTNWELIESVWSDGAIWETFERGYLNRNYGSEANSTNLDQEARHYKLPISDNVDDVIKLGNKIEFNNQASIVDGDIGIIFPQSKGKNIIYENGDTPLTVKVSHPGYINIWIKKLGSNNWEQILQNPDNPNQPLKVENNSEIMVKTKNILGDLHLVRVRYSMRKEDVLSPIGYALAGEVEDYEILGEEILELKFEDDSHKDLGITLPNNEVIDVENGKISYKEKLEYKIRIKNLSTSSITNQEFILKSNLGRMKNLTDFIANSVSETGEILENITKKITITKLSETSSEVSYLISITEMKGNENIIFTPNLYVENEYVVENSNYDFKLRDTILSVNVEKDKKETQIADMDYEKSIMGYNGANSTNIKESIYNFFTKRARHNVVEKGNKIIKLGNTISGDRNDKLNAGKLSYSNAQKLQEIDTSFGDGVDLRTMSNHGIPSVDLNRGPWHDSGPSGGYILYNKAKNRIPIRVTHDGWIGVWLHYKSYDWDDGYDYDLHKNGWNNTASKDGGDFYGYFQVKGNGVENYIEIDLSNKEGWYKRYNYRSGHYTNSQPDYYTTNTAIMRVRYALTKEEIESFNGISLSGEVEDYKINRFLQPFVVTFGEITDLGIPGDAENEILGSGDKHLTFGEKFSRTLSIKNITRATQEKKSVILRTSMASITQESLNNYKTGDIIIEEISGGHNYRDVHYDGVYFREYKITINKIEANTNIEIPIEFIIDNIGKYPNRNYRGYSWHLFQYIQYDNRTIAESEATRLYHDRGYNGSTSDTVKHFKFFGDDGKETSLGASIDYEVDDGNYSSTGDESETGNGLSSNPEEGILNFPRHKKYNESFAINTLYSGADHEFQINVSHNGWIKLYANLGSASSPDWKVLTQDPQPVVAGMNNNINFKFPDGYDGAVNKILRVRYGLRKVDVEENGDNPMKVASTGEVEDYYFRVLPPISLTFTKWEDLGVETDIVDGNGNKIKFGVRDRNWGINEFVCQHIEITNQTQTDYTPEQLESKLIKFKTNLGTIVTGKENFKLSIVNSGVETEIPSEKIGDYIEKLTTEKTDGVSKIYYFQLKKLSPETTYKFSFDFQIQRETAYKNLQNDIYVAKNQTETGLLEDTTENGKGQVSSAVFPIAKVDGGLSGWHYYVLEKPQLNKDKSLKDIYNDSFSSGVITEGTVGDNDGVDIFSYENILTLLSTVENEFTFYPTHEGFIRVWLDNILLKSKDGVATFRVTKDDINNGKKVIKLVIPDKRNDGTSLHSNEANLYLKVKYTQIESEVENSGNNINATTNRGASTGESEEYKVRVISPLDIKFITYEELGVYLEGEIDKTYYGINDGNIGYGERVRETFVVENLSSFDFVRDNGDFDGKLIELNMKNAILELKNGAIDLDKLNLVVLEKNILTKKVRNITPTVEVQRIKDGQYQFKLVKIAANSELTLSYNFLVNGDSNIINNEYSVYNTIGVSNGTNLVRDNTDTPKISNPGKYHYPKMKIDTALNNSQYNKDRHHYVKEEPHLGENTYYETGEKEENDGLILPSIKRFGETSGIVTLFSEEWNDIKLTKISHPGYITIWIDEQQIPIRTSNGQTLDPYYVEGEQEIPLQIIPPATLENETGVANQTLIIRYSVFQEDVKSLNTPARIGESELYKIRVIPSIDGRFVHWEESSNGGEIDLRRDLGRKLSSTAAVGMKGLVFGEKDGNYTLYEHFEEQIFIKNLNNKDTEARTLIFNSNIAEAYTDYETKGIEVKLYTKEINSSDTAYEIIKNGKLAENQPIYSSSGKQITISNLKLKANEQGVLVFKLKVVEEDRSNWRVINNFSIGKTFQDQTNDATKNGRVHPLILDKSRNNILLNKEGYYPQFKRDYENNSISYDIYDYGNQHYELASSGLKAYMLSSENEPKDLDLITENPTNLNQKYIGLGEKILPENVYSDRTHTISWTGSNSRVDDDSLIQDGVDGRGLGDIHKKGKNNILYNAAYNLLPIEVTHNGFVTISLWSRRHDSIGDGPWGTNGEFLLPRGLSEKKVEVTAGLNLIDVYVPNKWYDDHVYDWDHQDESSRYGVLRIKYALESDDVGLTGIDNRMIKTGEVEEYQIVSFEPAIQIDNIEIADMGTNDPRLKTSNPNYNAGDNRLSYGEYFYYILSIHNPSTSKQTKTFIHRNGDGNLVYNTDLREEGLTDTMKYREIYTDTAELIESKFDSKIDNEIVKDSNVSEATIEVVESGNKDAQITVKNIKPGETIKIRYLARIINEHQVNYNEEGSSSWYYHNKYNQVVYKWYGQDEFWMDRRKMIIDPAGKNSTSLSTYLINGKNYILKGPGVNGDGTDNLTTRDYGNGYIGHKRSYDGKIVAQTNLTEARHHMAIADDGTIMKIGDIDGDIDFENTMNDLSSDDIDGIKFLHGAEDEYPGENIVYGGIKNALELTVSHPGYVTFFINNGKDYIQGNVNSDYWKADDLLASAKDTREGDLGGTPPDDEFFSIEPLEVSKGTNKIAIKVPDFPEGNRILRIRYSAHSEDIKTPEGVSRTGEVQDIRIRIIPLTTGFKENLDLGVETEKNSTNLEEKRIGYDDKKFQYKEVYKCRFTVHNDSPYKKYDAKVVLHSNISRALIKDYAKLRRYEEEDTIKSINYPEHTNLKFSVETTTSTGIKGKGFDNIITISEMEANETVEIELHLFVEKEDIEDWRIIHQLWVGQKDEVTGVENLVMEAEERLLLMERDYGSGYLNENVIGSNPDPIKAS